MIFAYTRISTTKKTQKHDRQQLTIQTYADENNFIVNEWISETISGTVAAENRPLYGNMFKHFKSGDILIITDIDRIGRSADDVISELKKLKSIGVRVVALDVPYMNDWNNTNNDSMYNMIIDIVITLKAHMAQQEREKIVTRINQGLAAAKEKCKDPIVLIEQRLDFSKWVPQGFGTGDCVIVADETLTVIDFKYGVGILVEAEKNPQMMCYALGALQLFDSIYDIDSVTMTIFQPRRDNVSTYTISKEELLKWADEVLAPTAQLAAKGEGEYKAGDHCQFCKVKAKCRKRAEYNLELARYDFEMPSTLEDDEIEAILAKADALVSWTGDVKEYALQQAVSGKQWKDWKIVEGRSNRKYVNETAVADTVKNAGYDPFEHKVLGITAMTKLLGKTKFEELLSGFIEKPQGKPTLVPMSDKRPAMNTAANDFKEDN